jgi:hypothetical protein
VTASLSAAQREALRLLREHGDPVIGPGGGVLMTEASRLIDGQPWIHWRTGEALERRGLASIVRVPGEYAEITLTADGAAKRVCAICGLPVEECKFAANGQCATKEATA